MSRNVLSTGNKACNARIATSLSVDCTVRARPVKHATVPPLVAVKISNLNENPSWGHPTARQPSDPPRDTCQAETRGAYLVNTRAVCASRRSFLRYVPFVGCTPFLPATPRWPPGGTRRARPAYRPRQVGPAARDRHRAVRLPTARSG